MGFSIADAMTQFYNIAGRAGNFLSIDIKSMGNNVADILISFLTAETSSQFFNWSFSARLDTSVLS